jgi:glycine cleavage system protein P-like pyridoxal-binding family
VQIKSDQNGEVDLDLERHLDEDVAALMITVPNTLGLFESASWRRRACVTRRAPRSTWTVRT